MGWKVFHAMLFHGNSAFLSMGEVFHESVFHAAKRVLPLQETFHERVFHATPLHAVEHSLFSFHAPMFHAIWTRPSVALEKMFHERVFHAPPKRVAEVWIPPDRGAGKARSASEDEESALDG